MWKRTLTWTVLGIAAATPLFAGGCASEENPSAVTGQQEVTGNDPNAYDRSGAYHSDWEGKPWMNPRFQDQKGHYHPEWVGSSGH